MVFMEGEKNKLCWISSGNNTKWVVAWWILALHPKAFFLLSHLRKYFALANFTGHAELWSNHLLCYGRGLSTHLRHIGNSVHEKCLCQFFSDVTWVPKVSVPARSCVLPFISSRSLRLCSAFINPFPQYLALCWECCRPVPSGLYFPFHLS